MTRGNDLLTRLYNFIKGLLFARPVKLAIVRRYCDANGSYVGELYMEQEFAGVSSYQMVGASLDTLPYGISRDDAIGDELDARNDFLAPMPPMTVRVGALDPDDNDRVRAMVARLPRRGMSLVVQNRFIEHVLEARKA
jgi:hypothetical protein